MICTSPCFPKCTSQATLTVKTLGKSFLGHNCDVHVPKTTAKDYLVEPIAKPETEPTP